MDQIKQWVQLGQKSLVVSLTVLILLFNPPDCRTSRSLIKSSFPEMISSASSIRSLSSATSLQEAVTIPFELSGNHIYVQGRVNDSKSLWLLIDSGASRSVINSKKAQELGLHLEGNYQLSGSGGSVRSARVKDLSVTLAGITFPISRASALPLDNIEIFAGRSVDLVLGYDLFMRFIVEIDYEAKLLRLYDANGYEYDGHGEVLPILLSRNQPLVNAEIHLPKGDSVSGQFTIDTGAQCALMLQSDFVKQRQLLKSIRKTVQAPVVGVGGDLQVKVGRVTSLRWGPFVMQGPVVLFPETEVGTFAGSHKSGNIGGAILRKFKLIFDYARERIILEPNGYFSEPEEFDMSGALVMAGSRDFKTVRVKFVMMNSPSSDAGLRPGDFITNIDGLPVEELGLRKVRDMFKHRGRKYTVNVLRQQKPLKISMKLRQLI